MAYQNKYFKRDRFYAEEFGTQLSNDKDSSAKSGKRGGSEKTAPAAGAGKLSEYGKQLKEKQRVRFLYGVSENQFRNLFNKVSHEKGVTGESLLLGLERRLDNVLYRLKLGASRKQCRQMVVHGHAFVNGVRVSSPSFQVAVGDVVSLDERSLAKESFVKQVVEKRLNRGIKVPEWLILDKEKRSGEVVRLPLRAEIGTPIQEHLIVELYSK